MFYKYLILIVFAFVLTNCSLLDRRKGKGDEVADLEPIPEETIQEPSILIDDEEMMPTDDIYEDEASSTRNDQIDADPSGTFVGQKIPSLNDDFFAVKEAFDMHRSNYEEIKARVYGKFDARVVVDEFSR